MPRTSCTRTAPGAGLRGEHADDRRRQVAIVDGGVVGQQRAEESLARGADEDGRPSSASTSRRPSSCQFCAPRFAKPRPGIEDDALGRDAGRHEGVDAGRELVAHVGRDVAVLGERVHAVGVPAPVHGDVAHAGLGDDRRHRGIGEARRDVVDDLGAGLDRGRAVAARIVSTLTRMPRAASSRMTGTTRRSSSSGSTRAAPGRVDSPPTSSDVGAVGDEVEPVRDRGLGVEPPAAVAERVGRDVDDAHDERRLASATFGGPDQRDDLGARGRLGERAATRDRHGRAALLT